MFILIIIAFLLMQSGSNLTDYKRDENGFTWLNDHVDFNIPLSCNPDNAQQKHREESPVSKNCREGKMRIWEFNASFFLNRPGEYLSSSNIIKRSVNNLEDVSCGTENMANLNKTFFKITDPKSIVNIFVLGGSMTAGRLVGGYSGAWPRLLNSFLNNKLKPTGYENRFRVFNRAISATSSHWALNRLPFLIRPDEEADLIIVDYDINDCALIFDSDDSRGSYLSTIEVLIKRLLAYKSKPGVIFLNVAINHHGHFLRGTCDMFPTCYSLNEIRFQLLDLYGIPVISQRQAIWEFFDCQPYEHLWPCTKFCSHPYDTAHDLIADLVFGFLSGQSYNRQLCSQSKALRPFTDIEVYKADESLWTNEVKLHRFHPYSIRASECANVSSGDDLAKNINNKLLSQPFFHNKSKGLNDSTCWMHQTNIENEKDHSSPLTGQLIFKSRFKSNVESPLAFAPNNSSLLTLTRISPSDDNICWQYMEEVAGKPGWINQGCEDGSIYFR